VNGHVKEISHRVASEFLYPRHYSGRVPPITKAFGLYSSDTFDNSQLKAVCTFGKPASASLCKGVCGEEYSYNVYELNRLCRTDDWDKPLSQFVSACLRRLKKEDWIVVSYSDTGMNHHGYIYQACNFIYTGCTSPRTDKWTPNGKHSRHYSNSEQGRFRKVRTAKHRYVYFCTNKSRLKKEWSNSLKYEVLPYPKGDNSEDYKLGQYMKDIVVDCGGNDGTKIPTEETLW
jgi:hypothetical protein